MMRRPKKAQTQNLKGLFDEFNERCFGGKLPRFRVTQVSFFPDNIYGECLEKRRLIRLRRGLDPLMQRTALFHEMCHIGARGHGRRFTARVLAVVKSSGVADDLGLTPTEFIQRCPPLTRP